MAVEATSEEAAPAAPPNKGKKPLLLIAIAVVVIALAGSGFLLFAHRSQGPAKPELSKTAEYYALDPSIVVNFNDDRAIRFLQVGISLMTHDPKAIDAVKASEPAIRNALLLLFSSQTYETLSSSQGKLKLQQEALKKVQDVVQQSLGRPGIEAVYFTSFVMQ
ncbi:MAG TPA: flagellar basal body-associated FliL family protein [Rhodanobacteraceae bacterium]|nr:flagellar basal body-associated FliL family protein [Rhodanobacteraceae bacterium]